MPKKFKSVKPNCMEDVEGVSCWFKKWKVITTILQDSTNSMRNLHQIVMEVLDSVRMVSRQCFEGISVFKDHLGVCNNNLIIL